MTAPSGRAPIVVITTFETTPAACDELLEELRDAWETVLTRAPGFLGGAIHVNDAETRVASISRWRSREDFKAMLRSPEMRERARRLVRHVTSFEPVIHEEVAAWPAPQPAS